MYPKSFKKLIDHFASLPSIGPKMAERLVLYLFKEKPEKLADFAVALSEFKTSLRACARCFNISEEEFCQFCQSTKRNQKSICVVEDPLDIIAIEKTKKYDGLYHVLGGALGLNKHSGNSDLKITELEKRVLNEKTDEVIIATNPTTEGDATSLYIARILKDKGVRVTRLARGLATGGDIEYADEITLGAAITNRR